MIFKFNLILICVILVNLSEVSSDCDDFIKCVGDWFGDILTDNKKNNTVKAIEVPDVLSAVGDIFSDISHLIEDTIKTTIETSFTKSIGNETEIYIETFKFDDGVLNSNETLKEIKLSNIIDKVTGQVNDNGDNADSILIDLGLELKGNETEMKLVQNKSEDEQINAEIPVTLPDFNVTLTTVETSYHIINNENNETVLTDINNSIKNALSEDFLENKAILPDIEYKNTGYDNLNFTTVIFNNINVTYGVPLNVTETFENKTENIAIQNTSNVFINIPETVANNYKITFESPINVTHFDINTSNNLNAGTNSTQLFIKEEINTIENQNVQENEIIASEYEFDEVIVDDNATDYLAIDYIDLYKDTTNEDVEYTRATYIPTTTEAVIKSLEVNETNGIYSVFPWIATVFIKNSENNQFDYICDGAVLSNKIVLTAARCIMKENVAVDVESILVILGKRSLQENGPNERVLRVKTVKVHENFTSDEGKVDNDLAIIVLDEPITFNDDIQPVPLQNITGFEAIQTATTGWHVTGQLTPIYFSKESSATCKKNTEALNTFCAVFGDDIITCPSYGGLFVAKENDVEWRFQGLTTGSPTNRGACFNKNVTFTKIASHYKWIMDNIELNKN